MLNELITYPEIETFILINLFTNEEIVVTEQHLKNAFTEEELMKINSGRSNAWLIFDNF